LPLVSAGLVVALGVLSMAGRLTVRPMSHAAHSVEAAHDGR